MTGRRFVAGALTSLALVSVLVTVSGCDCAGPNGGHVMGRGDTGPIVDDAGTQTDTGTPGNPDPCGDGLDGDLDGRIDEGCACTPGAQQQCYRGEASQAGIGACHWGTQDCVSTMEFGIWDSCGGDGAPAPERCNGIDDNCDGATDEGCECLEGDERSCYTGDPATRDVGWCFSGYQACIIDAAGSHWDPNCTDEVLPATEECDGFFDDDCDGLIDEGCACAVGDSRPCYGGPSGTRGVGACEDGTQDCDASGWGACLLDVTPTTEVCDNVSDDDCDGDTDCADSDCATDPACCTTFDETVPIVPTSTELLFVVDRSGSMDFPAQGTTNTRWVELEGAMNSVLPSLSDIPLGLLTFPLLDGTSELRSCMVPSMPDLAIALGTGSAISARLVAADPRGGDTPTPQAFAVADTYLRSHPSTMTRFVVLATDGLPEPNCGSTVAATVTAITSLRTSLGIDTFVLGFVGPDRNGDTSGIPALQAGLNQMADAGGRARSGSLHYYEAVDGAAFERSLRAILASATDCSLDLTTTPARPGSVVVRQNGVVVPRVLYTISGNHLTFTGAACDAMRSGAVTSVTASDMCGG